MLVPNPIPALLQVLLVISLYLALKAYAVHCESHCATEEAAAFATVVKLETSRVERAFGKFSRQIAALPVEAVCLASSLARSAKLVFQIPSRRRLHTR